MGEERRQRDSGGGREREREADRDRQRDIVPTSSPCKAAFSEKTSLPLANLKHFTQSQTQRLNFTYHYTCVYAWYICICVACVCEVCICLHTHACTY